MSHREAFLEAIERDPYDMGIRKIFADWLEENDEPELATFHREMTAEKYREAVKCLTRLADACEVSYERVLGAMSSDLDGDEWAGRIHLRFDTPEIAYDERTAQWESFHIVTGRVVPDERKGNSFISCSC